LHDDVGLDAVDARQVFGELLQLFARARAEHQVGVAATELTRKLFAEAGGSAGNERRGSAEYVALGHQLPQSPRWPRCRK
jgi:hypothetical protein